MDLSLLSPLDYYVKEGKEAHKKNAKDYFDNLFRQSKVNREENIKTCNEYRAQLKIVDGLKKKLNLFKALRILCIVFAVLGIVGFALAVSEPELIAITVIGAVLAVGCILMIFLWLNKRIKHFDEKYSAAAKVAADLLAEAQRQIAPLLALFDDRDTFRLLEKTLPQLKLDYNFTPERLFQLQDKYDFGDGPIDENSSAIDTLSGTLINNPFVFQRYRYTYMGQYTYRGSLVIRWTTTYRDSQGKVRTRTHTQTLHASLVKPKPCYKVRTVLSYGNQAAPDLSFSRKVSYTNELNDGQIERKIEKGEKKLAKKARKALVKGGSFTEMSNSEFDVLFGAVDRDHEQQFRVLFTPLAQTGMVDLIRSDDGYGDDFAFVKSKRINHICSDHAQRWHMDTSPSNYATYDIEECERKFISFNEEYFKSVFFDFAPLLTIPAYQHSPVPSMEAPERSANFTEREYEVMANRLGTDNFAHVNSITDTILKTTCLSSTDEFDSVRVTAYSYGGINRTDFVSVLGGDGRFHAVPVHWVEYYPLTRDSGMTVRRTDMSSSQYASSADADPSTAVFHGLMATLDGQ